MAVEILPPERERAAMPQFRYRSAQAAKAGIGLGTALAVTISWSLHKSILWAIIHGFLSWLYVGYYAVAR
jgi:hypothetical protein